MKDNKRRITSSRKMFLKKIDVLVLMGLLAGVTIAANSCEIGKVKTKDVNHTSIESEYSDIIITDASNMYERVSLDDYKPEEDSTAFVNKHIKNNNLVRTLRKKKGR